MSDCTRHHSRLIVPAILVALVALLTSAFGANAASSRHATAGPVYGGTMHVAFTGNPVTFDPSQAVGVDWYLMNGTLFNGLYQFDRNGVPRLDLAAAAPTISADQRVWTFTLRKGVLFHNGAEVTADDLKYSILRTLSPHLKPAVSWGQPSDDIFVGSHAFVLGQATDVPGIQVVDRYTIRFTLVRPDAIFPYLMAETFNMVVPKAVVMKEGDIAFGNNPVGTGPFMLQSWKKGVNVVLVKNAHYYHAGKPYLDKLIADTSVPASVIALRIEKGELTGVALAFDVTAADIQRESADPKFATYLHTTPINDVVWLDLNVHVAPFTSKALREAVAMAIDRRHLVQLMGGPGAARPATQMYVPLMPQYDPTLDQHPVYAYDPVKAEALVKASGYKGQPISLIYGNTSTWNIATMPGIQQELHQIGLNVSIRGMASHSVYTLASRLTGSQLASSSWGIDFADAWDIYNGVLSCPVNGDVQLGYAHYCDPVADALANKAQTLTLGESRNVLFRQAQLRVLQSAAHVPLVFLKNTEMMSPRVGGFYYHPYFGQQYENYWLNP